MDKYDVIVIGSGIGGLSCASHISKYSDKKVLILEQNNVIGGLTSGFHRKGYYFEAGTLGINLIDMFKALLYDIDPVLPDEVHRQFYKYVICDKVCDGKNTKEIEDQYVKMFPENEKKVRRFFKFINKGAKIIKDFFSVFDHYKYFKSGFLKKALTMLKLTPVIIKNAWFFIFYYPKQLNTVLLEYFGSIKTNPGYYFANMSYYYNPPFFMFVGMWFEYVRGLGGAKNGYLEMVEKIAKVATDNGVTLLKKQKVNKIIIENGQAVGVETDTDTFYAEHIVSNIDLKKLILTMCPDFTFKKSLQKRLSEAQPSESGLILYLGVKMTNDEVKKYIPETEMLYVNKDFKPVNDIYEYMKICSLQVSPSYYLTGDRVKDGGTSVIVHVSIPPELHSPWWDLEKEEYKEAKRKLKDILVERMETLIPGITSKIEVIDLATPKTLENWVNCTGGASSGFSWDRKKSFMKALSLTKVYLQTPVKNLYQVGMFSFQAGGGVYGSSLSGRLGAELICGKKFNSYINVEKK